MTSNPASVGPAPRVLEAIAHNLCSLHDFDPAFVLGQERFARAVITEYERACRTAPHPDREAEPTGGVVTRRALEKIASGFAGCDDFQEAQAIATEALSVSPPVVEGSLRASPCVPTEGHEAAVVAAAKALNGSEYGSEGSSQIWAEMKARGLVAVFGASDDLMEFRGAIDDELSAYGGTTALVTPEGLFEPCEARCKAGREAVKAAVPIEALWDADGYSWTYKTDIPHATFEVMEDGEPYCRGIIFALADAKPRTANAVGIPASCRDEPKARHQPTTPGEQGEEG